MIQPSPFYSQSGSSPPTSNGGTTVALSAGPLWRPCTPPRPSHNRPPDPEDFLRVPELAKRWKLSANTIIKLFKDEPGVIRLRAERAGKRSYVTLRIPPQVASKVYERMTHVPSAETRPPSVTRARVPLDEWKRRIAA